ncbi:MAG: hypothetical protein P1V51_11730 [Deltaproteobacteria bacterium]|nr:hypothetical protein [Deltaproteobacteria bacterium]
METKTTRLRPLASPAFDADEKGLLRRFVRGELTFAQLEGLGEREARRLADLGHELFRRGRLHDARVLFEGMCALNPLDPYPHQILGAIAEREERREEAEAHYDLCLGLKARNPWVLARRGELRLLRDAVGEGVIDLERALDLAPPGASYRSRAEVLLERLRGAARQGASAALAADGLPPASA